ncbi:MAG: hypothetical protein ACXVKL_17260, partial [Candidatus Angelobacter sp.]
HNETPIRIHFEHADRGGTSCIYPWYTLSKSGFHYGVDYPDTLDDFGRQNTKGAEAPSARYPI